MNEFWAELLEKTPGGTSERISVATFAYISKGAFGRIHGTAD